MAVFFVPLISRSSKLIITATDLVLGRGSRTSLMTARVVSPGDVHTQVKPIIRRESPLMLVDTLDSLIGFFWGLAVISSLEVMAATHRIVVDI